MAKVRCPGCGAKNDSLSRRCRVCTKVINTEIADEATAPPPAPASAPLGDHFDARALESQLVAPKARFSSGGGLSARIAAANGGELPPPSFGKNAGEGSLAVPKVDLSAVPPPSASRAAAPSSFDAADLLSFEPLPVPGPPDAPVAGPVAGPAAPAEEERFDADALFRDMGR